MAALLALVCALWVFAAWVTTREGANLIFVQTLNTAVFEPSEPLLLELQQERRLTQEYLGKPTAEQRTALDAERQKITGLAATFQQSATSWKANVAGSAELEHRISLTITALNGLADTRNAVDARQIDRGAAASAYTDAINSIFQVYDALGQLDDKQITHDTAALIQVQRTRELLSQEDGLLAGIIATGRITAAEATQFTQLVGAQRFLGSEAAAALSAGDRARYSQELSNEATLRAIEDRVIQSARPGAQLPTDAGEWRSAVDPALTGLHDVISAGGTAIVARATPVAIWVLVRTGVAAGLGLLAVAAAILVSIATLRDLASRLKRLRSAAHELSDERLPGLMVRLSRGDKVDVAKEAPPLDFGNDEIGQVGHAFNAVQRTAVQAAVDQAELRRSVRDVFLSLARRSQALVHRQLQLLDSMERQETGADELRDLFAVDHLATRMRRNAENLIVLSGAVAGRGWRNPVPMVDVIRGALAEVEDYTRVTVLPVESAALAGRAVGDVIHLLAELIENAVSFSPPYTPVHVGGAPVANGFAVEIEDRGLGMSDVDLAAMNEQLADPPEFNLTSTAKLGLFVVGQLAARHGITVSLRKSPYGGTTAIVLIPAGLVIDEQDASVRPRRPGRLARQDSWTSESSTAVGTALPWEPAAVMSTAAFESRAEAYSGPDDQPINSTAGDSTAGGSLSVDGGQPEFGRRGAARHAAAPDAPPGWPVPRPRMASGSSPAPELASAPWATSTPSTSAPMPSTIIPALEARPLSAAPSGAAPGEERPARVAPEQGRESAAAPTHFVLAGAALGTESSTGAGEPVDAEMARTVDEASAGAPAIYTEAGLPWRTRQAILAAPLRDLPAESAAPADQAQIRDPDEIRRLMSSYQTGTRRGRSDADQATSWSTPATPAQSTPAQSAAAQSTLTPAATSPAPAEPAAPAPPTWPAPPDSSAEAGQQPTYDYPAPSTQHIPPAEPADGQQS